MEHRAVESKNIQSIAHDPETDTLEIQFHGGRIYEYRAVSAETFKNLLKSPSKGKFVNSHIKGKHEFRAAGEKDWRK